MLLELELEVSGSPEFIGGQMCSLFDIDHAIGVLRRTEIEALLGRSTHHHSLTEVEDAAKTIFSAVESRLRDFGNEPVHAYIDVWRLQVLAKHALLDLLGKPTTVRAIQREAVGCWPLTVCVGRFNRRVYEAPLGLKGLRAADLRKRARDAIAEGRLTTWLGDAKLLTLPGVSYSHGDGCGRAHPESKAENKLFKRHCDPCACGSGNRQRHLEREFWAIKQGRLGDYGRSQCAVCGEPFTMTRSNQSRCEECRRLHRTPATNSAL